MLFVRPSYQISKRWRLNPTFAFGGGDSDKVWELQPQLQFQVTDNFAVRFGYRKLFYEIDADNGNSFEGAFEGLLPFLSPQAWRQVLQRALVACAAELVGVGRHLLESALEYARVRQQFGRPIGSFQGLQWKLVDAALELERAASAVAWAALCVDASAPEADRAVHCAKLEAGLAARHCARTSLQVHGGIGYTWEHGLHFWLRRAYAGDAFMGPSDYHARCLAALLFAA